MIPSLFTRPRPVNAVRHLFASSAAAALIAGMGATAVEAQTPSPNVAAEPVTTEDTIVVTGYRGSLRSNAAQKRAANAFVDAISAEDIGKFPDKNVADALQRVPGVVIERDGGEGSRVSIRGLKSDLVLTQLNGNFIASADSGNPSRSFNYVMLPSNMISNVEVYKSPEARLDEGGVGGTVLLRTHRPLDLKPFSGFAAIEGTHGDTTRKIDPQISGMLSWRNEDRTLGLLLGATYQRRTNREMNVETETWRWWTADRKGHPATDINGTPFANDDAISYWTGSMPATLKDKSYWAPQSVNAGIKNENRQRLGIQATAQFKPTDDLTFTANYFRFELRGDYTSNILKIPEWGYRNFFNGGTFDPSGTILTGAKFAVPSPLKGCSLTSPPCTMETPQLSGYYSREKVVSNTFDLRADYKGDAIDVSAIVGKTRATGGPGMHFRMGAKPRFTTSTTGVNGNMISNWDFSDGHLKFEFSPEVQGNLRKGIAQIDTGSSYASYTNSAIEQLYAQVDTTVKFDDWIKSLQFGVKYRDGKVQRRIGDNIWYADRAKNIWYQRSTEGRIADPSYFYPAPIGNIAGGFDANIFPGIDFNAYLAGLNKKFGAHERKDNKDYTFDVGERIWAGYVQGNFESDALRGNIGLRVAHTRQYGQSASMITKYVQAYETTDGTPMGPVKYDKDGYPVKLAEDQAVKRSVVLTREDKSYTDFLPSANVAYDLMPDLVLRAAVARVVARPGFAEIGERQNFSFVSDAYANQRKEFGTRAGWSGNGGNKDLKPYSAWQYDLGVEYYFHPGSVLGATLFRKDVANFIVPLVIDFDRSIEGQQVKVQPYATQANGGRAYSQGIEVYGQHIFPFGLGLQANFTYNATSISDVKVDGKKVGTSPLVGSAKTQLNGSIFYENDDFLVRASYNRRGTVVKGIASGLNVYADPYSQIDLNASWKLMDNLTLSGAIINLTKSEQREHLGKDTTARLYTNSYSGRRIYLGLSYKF